MKRILYLIISFALIGSIFSCTNSNARSQEPVEEELPKNAIRFIYDYHLYLPAVINDSLKGNYIFDTGADALYLDKTYFEQSGLKSANISKVELRGIGENTQSVKLIHESTSFQSSGYNHNFDSYIVLDLRSIVGCHVDGVIGLQPFLERPLEVNYEQSYLRTFINETPFTKGYMKFPLKIKDNRLFAQLTVSVAKGKTIKGWFLIDFGSGVYVSISNSVAKEVRIADVPKKQVELEMIYGGVGGVSKSVRLRSDYIAFGSDTLKNVPIEYSLDTQGALGDTEYYGLIGNQLLKQYNWIFDFEKNTFYLKPISSDKTDFPSSKWQFVYSNRTDITPYWIVNGVYGGSNADKAGLSKGDSISHINGKAVNTITWEEERGRALPDILELTVKTRNGENKTIRVDTREKVL